MLSIIKDRWCIRNQ